MSKKRSRINQALIQTENVQRESNPKCKIDKQAYGDYIRVYLTWKTLIHSGSVRDCCQAKPNEIYCQNLV